LQGSDTASATYSTTATVTSPVVAGGYPITATVTGTNLANYTVTVVPGTLTVTPAALQISVANATKIYGTANPAFTSTLTGVVNGDTVPIAYSTAATATTGVGTYAISASTTNTNYAATVVAGTLTITPAPLTIAVNSFTKVYGSANPTFTGSVSGLLFSDTVVTTYATTAVQFSYVNTYPITASISGGASANYRPVVTNGTLTITQALLKIAVNNGTRVYGSANPAFSGTVTGILNNDAVVVSYSSAATVKTTVGSYADISATISGTPAVNYSPQVTVGTLTITPAPLKVAVNASSRVYGAANPAFTDTFTGLVNGDNLTSTYATTATATSPVGSYPITLTLSGTLLPNYAPAITSGTLTVTKAALTVVVGSASRVYGLANPTLTGTITGQLNSDVITATYATTATTASAVGTYPITATLSGAALANYTPVITNGTLTVTKAALTVVVGSASRVYGSANPTLTGTITGQLNGDVITATYATTATATSAVGTYPITATLSGTALTNYAPVITSGTLTVTKATLKVVVGSASRVYGAANPTLTGTITGQLNGDVITATYATTATTASAVGTYAITATLSGAALANYTPVITNGTLTVTKATLTVVVGSVSRVYGAANPTLTGTITGQLNGDVITATYATTATTASAVGTYAITATLSGTALTNYAPVITSGTLTVTALGTTATPSFTPAAGSFTGSQSIMLADGTTGATIFYTTNGAVPTTSSTKYTGAIVVGATETIEAIAIAPGYAQSAVASGKFTIN
jgi:hypothetical protein